MASVDVAIPSYNYGRYLRDCVKSVLSQHVEGLRVLVIDNASQDDSVEIAQQLAATDSRVEVLARPRNLGPHASFNAAIDWARADYFLILCADDLVAPGSLWRAVEVMERHPGVAISYGRSKGSLAAAATSSAATSWRIFPGRTLLERFCSTGICHISGCTALVRTSVQKAVGYYRPSLPHTDDFEMWLRFCLAGDVAETDAVQGVLRQHGANQSAFVARDHLRDIVHCEDAFESFFAHEGAGLPDARRLRRLSRRGLGQRAYWSGLSHLARGDRTIGLGLLARAARLTPASFVVPPLGYLWRRGDAGVRAAAVLAQMTGRPAGAVGER